MIQYSYFVATFSFLQIPCFLNSEGLYEIFWKSSGIAFGKFDTLAILDQQPGQRTYAYQITKISSKGVGKGVKILFVRILV